MTVLHNKSAIDFLCTVFSKINPENSLRTRIWSVETESGCFDCLAKVTIVGFSEDKHRKSGKFENILEKKGAVSLFGDEQPNFGIILEYEGNHNMFLLDNVEIAHDIPRENTIRISSESWEKVSFIEIYIQNVYSGVEALTVFKKKLEPAINGRKVTARLGKWVSKKVFDRSLKRHVSEKMAIEYDLNNPEKESIKTMSIGSDILNIEFIQGNPAKNIDHTIKAKYQHDLTVINFYDMVIQTSVPGKEIGSQKAPSTYIYLIGTIYTAIVNLIIIRHPKTNL